MNPDNILYSKNPHEDSLINRYLAMKNELRMGFFDVDEFLYIIDFFIDSFDFSAAKQALKIAQQQHPSAIDIQIRKAKVLIESGEIERGIDIVSDLEKIEPNNEDLLLSKAYALNIQGNHNDAEHIYDKILNTSSDDVDDISFHIAMDYTNLGHYNYALKYLLPAYNHEPDNLEYIYELAYCYEQNDEPQKAAEFYRKYLDEEPYAEHIWHNLGMVLAHAGNYEEAVEAYDFVLAIDDHYSAAYFNKAFAQASMGDYEKAIITFSEFNEFEEKNKHSYCYMAECYEKLNKIDLAINYYSKALSVDENFSDAWLGMGMSYKIKENFIRAIQYVKKACRLEKENLAFKYELSDLYIKIGDYRSSNYMLDQVIEISPIELSAHLQKSENYFMLGDSEKALFVLEDALNYVNDSPELEYRLTAFYLINGENEKAYHCFDRAFSKDNRAYKDIYKFYPQAQFDRQINSKIKDLSV